MEENKNIKYTTDGKKVVIIGNLNSQEKIVQEIFIVNGIEIPSGENFVVKSLHDSPAVSWKEQKEKEISDRYDIASKKLEDETYEMKNKLSKMVEIFRKKAEWLQKATEQFNPEIFNTLINVLSGNIKYLINTEHAPELIEYTDFTETRERDLRLFSFYGESKGNFAYGIGDYSDFSGGRRKYKFFTNQEDALEFLKERIVNDLVYSDHSIKISEKHGFELDKEKLKVYYEGKLKNLKTNIEAYGKSLETWNNQLEEISKKIS